MPQVRSVLEGRGAAPHRDLALINLGDALYIAERES